MQLINTQLTYSFFFPFVPGAKSGAYFETIFAIAVKLRIKQKRKEYIPMKQMIPTFHKYIQYIPLP